MRVFMFSAKQKYGLREQGKTRVCEANQLLKKCLFYGMFGTNYAKCLAKKYYCGINTIS